MRFVKLTRPRLRVISAVCSNLFVLWLGTMLTARDIFVLLSNLIAGIISLGLAFKVEEMLEDL